MNPLRQLAESFILHAIDRLDTESEAAVIRICEGAPYPNAVEALMDFSGGMSITIDEVEWIRNTWAERQHVDPQADPKAFAAEVVPLLFSEDNLDL